MSEVHRTTAIQVLSVLLHESARSNHNLGEGLARAICQHPEAHGARAAVMYDLIAGDDKRSLALVAELLTPEMLDPVLDFAQVSFHLSDPRSPLYKWDDSRGTIIKKLLLYQALAH